MKTKTPEQLLEALTVEAANISTYKTQLGFSDLEIDESSQDKANTEVTLDNSDVMRADGKSVTGIKEEYFNGKSNAPIQPYPVVTLTRLPFPSMMAGALGRYNNRKGRAKLAAGYTKPIGIAMGYEDSPSDPISPDLLNAALKTYKNLGNYQFEATFMRQGMSGMLFQYRIKGTEKWFDIKTALLSPVTINIPPPATESAPVEIEIRVRLLDGNQQVGNWSPIYSLIVTA
ncbi:hypothetical protein BH10ACI1_BH10ACI1_16790 [soil metagenome]